MHLLRLKLQECNSDSQVIQVYSDGQKSVRKYRLEDNVSVLFQYIKHAYPAISERPFDVHFSQLADAFYRPLTYKMEIYDRGRKIGWCIACPRLPFMSTE